MSHRSGTGHIAAHPPDADNLFAQDEILQGIGQVSGFFRQSMCRQLISSLLFDYHTGAVRPGSHLGFCHLHFRLEIRAVVLVNQQCKQRALQVTAEQVHEEPVFQIATDVALPQAHQLYLPSSTSALRIRLDVLLYLCGHIRTHPPCSCSWSGHNKASVSCACAA